SEDVIRRMFVAGILFAPFYPIDRLTEINVSTAWQYAAFSIDASREPLMQEGLTKLSHALPATDIVNVWHQPDPKSRNNAVVLAYTKYGMHINDLVKFFDISRVTINRILQNAEITNRDQYGPSILKKDIFGKKGEMATLLD